MESRQFVADFYNNAAAIAVVLMFTKVVSHRTRKTNRKAGAVRLLAAIHVLAVTVAATSAVIALAATDFKWTGLGVRIATWSTLGLAGILLVLDIVVDELPHLRRPD